MAGGKRASAQHRGRIPKLICCYNKCRPHTIAAASAPKAGRRYGSHELLCRSEADRNDFARSCFAADLHSGSYHRQDRGRAPLPPKYQFPRCVPRGRKHDLPASSKQPARVLCPKGSAHEILLFRSKKRKAHVYRFWRKYREPFDQIEPERSDEAHGS